MLVPTTNFVLHWITGKSEGHRYDESLRSIDLVTKDAYEPTLPLSVVVHIDYEKAPRVIQRFGDVKQLITQTLDPLLSAYFRDVAHRKSMLELIHERDLIQKEAREELRAKFSAFDIECVDVLIGKPETASADGKIEMLLDQLRQRQLATEQIETFARQQQADASLARSRKEAEQTIVLAEAEARKRSLEGQGESEKITKIGQAEADVLMKKVASFGDSRLYAMSVVAEILARSRQPIVPRQLFASNGDANGSVLATLLKLVTVEKVGELDAGKVRSASDTNRGASC